MIGIFRKISFAIVLAALAASRSGFIAPVAAQDAEAFYRSHDKITMGSPSTAGGGYDTYTRLLGRHIAKYIPGTPTIVVQNIPAGGGMTLANELYATAPRDGTFIGLVRGPVLQARILGNAAALFDGRKFAWIGNMTVDYDTCIVWAATGITSVKDFYTRVVNVGSSGAGADSSLLPTVYDNMLGMRLKVIAGYAGTPARILAMQRGEIDGACGITTGNIRATLEQPYKEGKIRVVAQAGVSKDPGFPEVPSMLDEAKTPEIRAALAALFSELELGRTFASAPGTPVDRLALLRRAFDSAMKDPQLIEEANKLHIDIDWRDAAATQAAVDRLYATPQHAIDMLKAALAKSPGL